MKKQIVHLILVTFFFQFSFAQQWPDGTESLRIDSIKIQKNWRTKEAIIFNELKINHYGLKIHSFKQKNEILF